VDPEGCRRLNCDIVAQTDQKVVDDAPWQSLKSAIILSPPIENSEIKNGKCEVADTPRKGAILLIQPKSTAIEQLPEYTIFQ
jgi:hypothetical protein